MHGQSATERCARAALFQITGGARERRAVRRERAHRVESASLGLVKGILKLDKNPAIFCRLPRWTVFQTRLLCVREGGKPCGPATASLMPPGDNEQTLATWSVRPCALCVSIQKGFFLVLFHTFCTFKRVKA